jgi:hypothetical protein
MKRQQVSDHCFAVLNEANLVCDANSGLINLGDGVPSRWPVRSSVLKYTSSPTGGA